MAEIFFSAQYPGEDTNIIRADAIRKAFIK
jgi:hypothetical protein